MGLWRSPTSVVAGASPLSHQKSGSLGLRAPFFTGWMNPRAGISVHDEGG